MHKYDLWAKLEQFWPTGSQEPKKTINTRFPTYTCSDVCVTDKHLKALTPDIY